MRTTFPAALALVALAACSSTTSTGGTSSGSSSGGSSSGGSSSGGSSSGSADTTKYVFATSQDLKGGDIGGLAGADALCSQDAAAGGLKGTFKAFLSDKTTNVLARIADVGPWLMVGTTTEAVKNRTTLLVKVPLINWRDQNGTVVTGGGNGGPGSEGSTAFWTGTGESGATSSATCADWTSSAATDKGALVNSTQWNLAEYSCGGNVSSASGYPIRLLCIQQ